MEYFAAGRRRIYHSKGKEEMARLLDQYEDIDVVVSQNDDMTFGALEAIREAGKTAGVNGDITVISFDAVDAGVELVRNGEINIDVQCNPDQGKYVEQIIRDMEAGKEIEKAYYVPERGVYPGERWGGRKCYGRYFWLKMRR
ncbi:MAG: substrate-binding domain-containing protein [Lachnospiraceae bacterium]